MRLEANDYTRLLRSVTVDGAPLEGKNKKPGAREWEEALTYRNLVYNSLIRDRSGEIMNERVASWVRDAFESDRYK